MAGFWKAYYGVLDILRGMEGNFAPRGLALQLADRMLNTETRPLLADFAIEHYWIVWPAMLALIYVQLVALLAALRPRLHVAWGYLLIAFHVGTGLLMQIFFAKHVLLLMLFFVMSPFRPMHLALVAIIEDLPLFGAVARKLRQASYSARPRPVLEA
jgi:hypothetical protein